MLAEKIDTDDAWETELGIRDFVAREERRGCEFTSRDGARLRRTSLIRAWEEGFIERKSLSAAFQYQKDYDRFYNEFRCPSTLDYQSRVEPRRADDLILGAGLRLRRAEAVLTKAQRVLVRRVCGEDRITGDALLRELHWPLLRLQQHYVDAWDAEQSSIAIFQPEIADLRALGAVVAHRFQMGGGIHIIGAQALLIAAQGGLCSICRAQFPSSRGTIDHVVPLNSDLGHGYGGPGNILCAHASCNLERGNAPPDYEMLRELRRVNALLGWGAFADEDPEDQWQILTEGLARLPMAPDAAVPKHWPAPTSGVHGLGITAREWARRKVALERTLKRLEKLKAEPAPVAKPRFVPLAVAEAAPASEPEWTDLLPAKPSKDDSGMDQAWLAKAGVVRSNREMRHLGVQAKAAKRTKDKASGKIRKRVRRRGRS